jgi:hypothetical protein
MAILNCKYTIDQYRRALESSFENCVLASDLLRVILNDLWNYEKDPINRLKFIMDKKIPISLASELLTHQNNVLSKDELAFLKIIYNDEMSSSLKDQESYKSISAYDFLIPIIDRKSFNDSEISFYKDALFLCKDKFPETIKLFLQKTIKSSYVKKDDVLELFDELKTNFEENSQELKLLELLNKFIDNEYFINKIAIFLV